MSEWISRRARKQHSCDFCEEHIDPGSSYAYCRNTPWDHAVNDSFFSWHVHSFCLEVWNAVAPSWDYEWCEDYTEFRWEAESQFPAGDYPWKNETRS